MSTATQFRAGACEGAGRDGDRPAIPPFPAFVIFPAASVRASAVGRGPRAGLRPVCAAQVRERRSPAHSAQMMTMSMARRVRAQSG